VCHIFEPAFISVVSDIAVALSALAASCVAVFGLTSWRRELGGRVSFETARALLRGTYRLRDAVDVARSPFISATEFPTGYQPPPFNTTTAQKEVEAYAYIYKNRWIPVLTALQDFDSAALEAEALWLEDIRDKTDRFRRCLNKYRVAIDMDLDNRASGGKHFEVDRELAKRIRRDLSATHSDDNELSKEIEASVNDIKKFLRAHLVR